MWLLQGTPDVPWWKFWNPLSGLLGGLICGFLFFFGAWGVIWLIGALL